jgi:hypothetical protein
LLTFLLKIVLHDSFYNEKVTVTQETTVPPVGKGKKVTFDKNTKVAEPYFDKISA